MAAVDEHRGVVGVKPLCDARGVSRETDYRRRRPPKAGAIRRRVAEAFDTPAHESPAPFTHRISVDI
jgi:hypothetical protein